MSNENAQTETTEAPTDPTTDGPTDAPEAQDEPKAGNPEAAGYRRRLRDTESERDGLASRVEALQRSIADREIEARHGIKPAALWASGTELADVLDDDGQLDTDKLDAAVATAKETLGIPKRRTGPRAPREGNTPQMSEPKNDWADAFSTNKR